MRVRAYIDLDNCLLDTDALFDRLVDRAVDKLPVTEQFARSLRRSTEDAGFTLPGFAQALDCPPEKMDEVLELFEVTVRVHIANLLYKSRVEVLRALKMKYRDLLELVLITKGDIAYQFMKWNACDDLKDCFDKALFVASEESKGEVLLLEGWQRGTTDIFVDDLWENIQEVKRCAPWIQAFLMLAKNADAPASGCEYLRTADDLCELLEEALAGGLT